MAQAILRGLIDFKRDPWPSISETAKSLVKQMLEPDPKLRLTAKQVLGNLHILTSVALSGNRNFLVNMTILLKTVMIHLKMMRNSSFTDVFTYSSYNSMCNN